MGGLREIGDVGDICGGCLDRTAAIGVPVSWLGNVSNGERGEIGGGDGGLGMCIPDCRNEVASAEIGGLTRGVMVDGEKEEEYADGRDSRGDMDGCSLNERITIGPLGLFVVDVADDCRRVCDLGSMG